jgi:Uma2 family endonuclease
MAVEQRLMTAAELERLPDDGQRHELVRGELRTMPPGGGEHGSLASDFMSFLAPYVREHNLGKTFIADTGFRLASGPDTVRAPDGAFVRRERVETTGVVRSYWPGHPDIALEVISPNDLYTEVAEKVDEYLEYGTPLVIVMDPRRRRVTTHRPGQAPGIYGPDDVLEINDLIPGWKLPLRALFGRP